MDTIFKRKLNLGISACQFGAKFRYNGKGFDVTSYIERDRGEFTWTPICPEVMSGMGVPRPPIRLAGGNGADFWEKKAIIKNRNGEEKTLQMKAASLACMETLKNAKIDAYIYMEGSPSCGISRTTLKNRRLGKPPGVFGALLLDENIFLIDSIHLQSPVKWWDWKRRLVAFVWLKEQEINTFDDLKPLWDRLKYLAYEIDEEISTSIEKNILNSEPLSLKEVRESILNLLRESSSLEKIKKSLWDSYTNFKESSSLEVPSIYEPEVLRNMTHLRGEVNSLEIHARKNNLFFRSFPILYKPER